MGDRYKTKSYNRQGVIAYYKEIEKRQGGYANKEHKRLLEVKKGSRM
jgi:hypothetical protein